MMLGDDPFAGLPQFGAGYTNNLAPQMPTMAGPTGFTGQTPMGMSNPMHRGGMFGGGFNPMMMLSPMMGMMGGHMNPWMMLSPLFGSMLGGHK